MGARPERHQVREDECAGPFEILCLGRHGQVFCSTVGADRGNDVVLPEEHVKKCRLVRHQTGAVVTDDLYYYRYCEPKHNDHRKRPWQQWNLYEWTTDWDRTLGERVFRRLKDE